ncbi:MAG TPA: DinB family protein [Thermomicrobiales bacterium]|nr:DinB family protein [Thermomicrobiales bacterium]
MSERAQTLADRFEQANEEFVAVVSRLSEAQWRAYCPEEDRTVAALARHVAVGYAVEIDAFRALAEGQPVRTWTRAALAEVNAEDGSAYADCDEAETVQLLQREAAAAAAVVRSLSDEQLARSGVYVEELPTMTVDQWIERVLVGHPEGHLRSIRAAVEYQPV